MQNKSNDRANQFLPFDSLKGLSLALQEKEIVYEEKKDLSEEAMEEISNTINELDTGDLIKVKFYKNRQYQDFFGTFIKVDSIRRKILVNNNKETYEISIKEISNIQKNYWQKSHKRI